MTVNTMEQARRILFNYKESEDGVNYYLRVGNYLGEYPEVYAFICWPYSDEDPLDKSFAFEYWVKKDTGEIEMSDAPIKPDEALRLFQETENKSVAVS